MEPKEPSLQVRILLAFAASFVILFLSQRFLFPPPPAPPQQAANKPAPPPAAAPGEAPRSQSAVPPARGARPQGSGQGALPAEPRQGSAEEQITVEGDLYQVVFSTRGAAVKSWTLRRYRDEQNNPLDLVNADAAAQYGDPFSFWVSDETLRREINASLFVPSAKGSLKAPATLTFEYNNGRITARKQFVFAHDSYVANLTTELSSEGKPVVHALAWQGGFGDVHDVPTRGSSAQVFFRESQKLTRWNPKDLEKQEGAVSGLFPFAGIQDHFFAAVFLPQPPPVSSPAGSGPAPSVSAGPGALRVTGFRQEIALPGQENKFPTVGLAVGGADSPVNHLRVYVGPKDTEVLAAIEPRLPELVDYGWFPFIAKPLFLAMRWTYDHVVANYGWAIILLTIFINFALFPLKLKTMRSAMKMQQLQPQLRAIQDKYKHLKTRDPRRQEMTQETMALYKKHGVNPVGGCLPMLLQIPFFLGFYNVLLVSIEMRHAPWILWIQDLSAAEHIPIKTLPLLLCATQFVLQKMSPAPSPDPMQQKMMMFMPVMFLFLFWSMSSGLVLYWLTGNVVGIAQQWYINRTELRHLVEEKKAGRKKQPAAKK